MLRARPTRYTSVLPELRRLLTDLGLVPTEEGPGWAVLDAGSGRVRLCSVRPGSADDGMTAFSVEVRDPEAFARRTVEDGGKASLEDTIGGPRVRLTGPDGFTFYAEPTSHGATCADADPAVTVRMEWYTPDVAGAAAALAAIGARPRAGSAGPHDFTAKNGGVLAPREAPALRSGGLLFEYDGDLAALADRLAGRGWSPRTSGAEGGAPGRAAGVVRVSVPTADGREVTILSAASPIR